MCSSVDKNGWLLGGVDARIRLPTTSGVHRSRNYTTICLGVEFLARTTFCFLTFIRDKATGLEANRVGGNK